jgi:hypothetical protein
MFPARIIAYCLYWPSPRRQRNEQSERGGGHIGVGHVEAFPHVAQDD